MAYIPLIVMSDKQAHNQIAIVEFSYIQKAYMV
jgi:hypothetical protein